MSSHRTEDFLWNLLPRFIRNRDVSVGQPLRALLRLMEREHRRIEENIGRLYDDWFIETCAEWVVPYLGELLGVLGLNDPNAMLASQRTRVANTLAYRRRKGTAPVIARAAQDVTGWPCHPATGAPLLVRSQPLADVRLGTGGTVDLRDRAALEHLGGPFDRLAHTVDVSRPNRASADAAVPRGVSPGLDLRSLNLYFWRLESYPISLSAPRRVRERGYTFHPFGRDTPLFNRPQAMAGPTTGTRPENLPVRLPRWALAEEITARRHGHRHPDTFFGEEPAIEVFLDGEPVLPEAMVIWDLAGWRLPPSESWTYELRLPDGRTVRRPAEVAVDPQLGRLALLRDREPPRLDLRVGYSYGFSADLGGGPYDRRHTLARPTPETWRGVVLSSAAEPADGTPVFTDPATAVEAWIASGSPRGILEIADDATYRLRTSLVFGRGGDDAAGRRLHLEAADGCRPCLEGDLHLDAGGRPVTVTLNGLWIDGGIVLDGAVTLGIEHCTVGMPDRTRDARVRPAVIARGGDPSRVYVAARSSLLGPLRLPPELLGLEVTDSIIDGGGGPALAGADPHHPGPPTILERVTVLGPVALRRLDRAEDVLFTEVVRVEQPGFGEVRHSFVPAGSAVPAAADCEPGLSLRAATGTPGRRTLDRLRPSFTSTVYGHPGYAQLAATAPREILTGAHDGSEMGAFQRLHQSHRLANLPGVTREFVPWGLETRVILVT